MTPSLQSALIEGIVRCAAAAILVIAGPGPSASAQEPWVVRIQLDDPALRPHVVQIAVVDWDPLAAFAAEISAEGRRPAPVSELWNFAFRKVPGNELYLLVGGKGPAGERGQTGEESAGEQLTLSGGTSPGKRWAITKARGIDGKSVCWSVPFSVTSGAEVKVSLTANNRIDLIALRREGLRDGPDSPGRHAVDFKNEAIDGYVVHLPEDYSPGTAYPMIVAFHGAVGSADTAYRRWVSASGGFILICPSGTARMGWQLGVGQLDQILACIDDALDRFEVDPERVYLTGHSMGGHVCWNLAMFHASRFAAIAPTAAAPMDDANLAQVGSTPIYVVHGRRDNIVSLSRNRRAEKFINGHQGSMTLIVVEDAGHAFVLAQQPKIIGFFRAHR